MNGWDDYLAFMLSSENILNTPGELSADEFGIKEKYILDDILKLVDHLICDPDDVPFFLIEAAENHLLEDVWQHFGTDPERGSLVEDIRAGFKEKYSFEHKATSHTDSKIIEFREFVVKRQSFFTKNGQFDWKKWAEEYNSDDDELLPLPTARVLKNHCRKRKFKWDLLSFFLLDLAYLLPYICLAIFVVC